MGDEISATVMPASVMWVRPGIFTGWVSCEGVSVISQIGDQTSLMPSNLVLHFPIRI